MTETEGELENNLNDNDKPIEKDNKNKIFLVISILSILIVGAIITVILIFYDSDKDDEKTENNNELDTIPTEEFERARKSFKQYEYTEEGSSKILNYNFFIPENITNEQKYPLILFISDKSLVGKETKAPITETVGGPIWATDIVQKKHKCFVLVPQYNESIISSAGNKSEYVYMTLRLISELEEKYNIDSNRIYGTGQSMGAMTTLFLLANNDIFAAGLIADGHWLIEELYGLSNATFTFCAAEGDPNPFNSQNEVKEYFDVSNIKYGTLDLINAQDKVEILNEAAQKMYDLGYKRNFISYAKGTVLPPNSKNTNEHMASFKYTYRIEAVRDWLFEQKKF